MKDSINSRLKEEAISEGGWLANIEDFVVHDGPGLRVLVFFKGCPLRCKWCQNPECIAPLPEIEYQASRCIECLKCLEVCPVPGAILKGKEKRIDKSKCTRCMACVDACTGTALRKVGGWLSVKQVVEKVIRYKPFFDHSDRGGVTLSGGEPMFQPDFALKLIRSCRGVGIHTAMETCGYAKYEVLKKIAQNLDLLIYDVKHMDEASHVIGTGKSNRLILENLKRLCREVNTKIVVHVPLISGFNDEDENIIETAEFVSSLRKIQQIDLLPFNELASGKYKAMGLDWEYANVRRQSPEKLAKLQKIVESYGLEVTIGGLW